MYLLHTSGLLIVYPSSFIEQWLPCHIHVIIVITEIAWCTYIHVYNYVHTCNYMYVTHSGLPICMYIRTCTCTIVDMHIIIHMYTCFILSMLSTDTCTCTCSFTNKLKNGDNYSNGLEINKICTCSSRTEQASEITMITSPISMTPALYCCKLHNCDCLW